MAAFSLKMIASDKVFYDGRSEILIIPALDGEYTFLAHHDDMVVAVRPGETRFKNEKGEWITVITGLGFVNASNNRVTMLVDSAERPEEIDEIRARQHLERAREALRQKQSIQEYKLARASLARAISRLKGKNGKNINL